MPLVLVVSEERGTVSIAQHGTLNRVQPAEAKERLENYFQERAQSPPQASWPRRIGNNFAKRFVSLTLAAIIWLVFAYRVESVQRTFVVPIEYRNLSPDWVVEEPRAGWANVTLSGTERSLDMLETESLVISLDLSQMSQAGQASATPYVFRTRDSLALPDGVNINQIEPRTITVRIRPKTTATDG